MRYDHRDELGTKLEMVRADLFNQTLFLDEHKSMFLWLFRKI